MVRVDGKGNGDSLIRVRDLDKKYQRGSEEIDVLQGLNLDVDKGDFIAFMGPSGSGKTTLLKLLAGITEPSAGHAELDGRVGSLLEVGTGFHMELTGRENIFLSGAILGMRRAEIRRSFDAIVAFAGVEGFVDTPVKRYSSGMHLRLGFAVAAHLPCEILLIDEVLAVGDTAFQRRCLGRMGELAGTGRTVLLVSHNMAAVQALCSRALRLEQGRLLDEGAPAAVVTRYLQSIVQQPEVALAERRDRQGEGGARLLAARVRSVEEDGLIRPTSRLLLEVEYEVTDASSRPTSAPSPVKVAIAAIVRGTHGARHHGSPWAAMARTSSSRLGASTPPSQSLSGSTPSRAASSRRMRSSA